jgi:hypothetical protein
MPATLQDYAECPACGDEILQAAEGASTETPTAGFCSHCARNFFRCTLCAHITANRDRSPRNPSQCRRCGGVPRFTYTPIGEPPWLGVELEVESNDGEFNEAQSATLEALPENFVTLKDDGSLSEYGYEIVSRPASYVEQVAAWSPFFEAVHAGKMGSLTSWSNNTCGLHVHICRNAGTDWRSPLDAGGESSEPWRLSQHAQALLVCFVNLPSNRRFIQTIAGRDANSYTGFSRKRMRDAAVNTGRKYEAINLCHPATLEFRIFKGTLRAQSFFKALEFTLALSEFCRSIYNVRKALSVSAFVRFVSDNAAKYPHLDSFISNRWYGKRDRNGNCVWRLVNNRKPPLPPVEHGQNANERGI